MLAAGSVLLKSGLGPNVNIWMHNTTSKDFGP